MLAQQETQRMFGMRAELEAAEIERAISQRHLLYDDDHVYSASPTENTYAPTPSTEQRHLRQLASRTARRMMQIHVELG